MTTLSVLFLTTSVQFGLPSGLLESVCWIESQHNPAAVHKDDGGSDSIGLCQVKLETARWLGFRGPKSKLLDPKVNAHYAGMYLQYQLIRYRGNTQRALVAYNRGNAIALTSSAYSDRVMKYWGSQNERKARANIADGFNRTKKRSIINRMP